MLSVISQAVILSAGLGTRLREITGDELPKVMVPLDGKPILEWHIERLKSYGVTEFFINLFYLPDKIRDYFGDGSKWGVKINYCLEEPVIRGTAGGVKDFNEKLKGDFFVIYGDIFNEIDYSKMIEAYYRKPSIFAIEVVGYNDHLHDSDLAEVDDELRFLKIHPKPNKDIPPKFRVMRAAAFIFNEKVLKYIPVDTYYEIDHQLLPDALSKGELVYGYECDEFIKDVGTTERYKAVEEYLRKKNGT
jgi:mannose-1-phosphate guanylyltransferase / phosphomannomutase